MRSSCGDAGNQPSRENWEPNIRFGLESRKSLNRAGLWEIEKREPVRRQERTISTAGHRVGKRRVERKISSESARCAGRVVSLRRPLRYKALMKKVEMVGKMKSHPGNQKCHGKTPRSRKKKNHRIWYPPGAKMKSRLIGKHSATRRPLRNRALGKGR